LPFTDCPRTPSSTVDVITKFPSAGEGEAAGVWDRVAAGAVNMAIKASAAEMMRFFLDLLNIFPPALSEEAVA
jgi:hypothetical protein